MLDALERIAATDLHQVDLRLRGARLHVVRAPAAVIATAPAAQTLATGTTAVAPTPPATTAAADAPAAAASDAGADPDDGLEAVTSPMVGTFYRRPRPDAAAFVEVGDRVRAGQVLCIIEAMKLMNNIEAEVAGEIVRVVAEDAGPVQFGDRLFLIRPA